MQGVVIFAALPLLVANPVDLVDHFVERNFFGAERKGLALKAAAVEVGGQDELAFCACWIDVVPLPDHLEPCHWLEAAGLLLQLGQRVCLAEELRNPLYGLHQSNRIE